MSAFPPSFVPHASLLRPALRDVQRLIVRALRRARAYARGMTDLAVQFSGPRTIPYPGGCVLEPAPYALDYLLKWPADITVKGKVYADRQVFPFIRELLAAPEHYGLTHAEAQAARERYLDLAGQALEQAGGQRAWLVREFTR